MPQDLSEKSYKNFQLSGDPNTKRGKSYGEVVAKHIVDYIVGSTYFQDRNMRFAKNREWFSGRIDVLAMFRDRMNFGKKQNYINLKWNCLFMVNTIVTRLVGRWMNRQEKIVVTATDPLSIKQKNEQYKEILFELEHRKEIAELEDAIGVPLVPKDQYRPADEGELELWRSELQRLPEEILYETNTNDALFANGFFDVIKEKELTDSAVVGLLAAYTWMDKDGVIHSEHIKPENVFYSYSEYPDFRDTSIRGRIVSRKLSEIRQRYGKENGGDLDEKQIFELACTAKEWQKNDKISWVDDWLYSFSRPYDDWNIDIVEFEVKTFDEETNTVTVTEKHKSTILRKGSVEKVGENQEVFKSGKWNIYEGFYAREAKMILHWGVKKNMIRPQDPKEVGDCEFSYSFYMPQNDGIGNLAIPQKIEEPIEAMILTRLKMQQLISRMRPPGSLINESALREIDYGLGAENTSIDARKLYDQTGDLFYRDKDAAGNPIPVPIVELSNSGFLPQMQALIQKYAYDFSVLKDELGEDPNLINQAATPRVSQGNIQTAIEQGDNATGYMYRAFIYLMEDVAKKMACLMHDSVLYGAKAYRGIMNEKDVRGRVFGTKIQMLPQQYELQNLQAILNQAIASTPDLVLYLDVFKVMRLARENIKLGELFYQQAMKAMLRSKAEQATKNAMENAQVQEAAAQQAAQASAQAKAMEGQMKIQTSQIDEQAKNKSTLLAGIMKMYEIQQTTGTPIPMELLPIARATLENVALPAAVQNEELKRSLIDQMNNQAMQDEQMQDQSEDSVRQEELQEAV